MKFLHKVIAGTAIIGSLNVAYAYFSMPRRPRITAIKNSSAKTPDKRRFNKNPMDDKKKRHKYSVCIIKQEEKNIFFPESHKFCKDKWLK